MPIHYIRPVSPDGILSIWRGQEEESYYLDRLTLSDSETEILDQLSARKRLEWVTSRYLLHIMSGRKSRARLDKDENGKPYIVGARHHISLSHSGEMTAVIASRQCVGIDIQIKVPKISRIAQKFCNAYERDHLPTDWLSYYHIIWGAKESIYKAYGKRKVDFKKHMRIYDVDDNLDHGYAKGEINIDGYSAAYQIRYDTVGEYMLVWSVEVWENKREKSN